MSPRFYQGSSITGPVRVSSAQCWKEVVDIFRMCPTIPLSRKAFLALPKHERNEKKQVPFFVPACFREPVSKRTYEQATHCNLLFLDLDESPDGNCPAAPFVRNPQSLYTALEGLNFLAHTTASSTPEKPRLRIVVEAKEIPIVDYPRAVATIGARLGLTRITTESRVAVQPMYGAVFFTDSTDEDHPLIALEQGGAAFEPKDISTDAPDEWESHRPNGSNGSNGTHHGEDALFFLKAPLPEITLAVAKEALSKLDADCSYYEWLEIASALRHQFSPHKADEAYELFDEWSATGTKYTNADDTLAKWKSLRPSPVGRMPVTVRTLLRKAQEAGWNEQKVKDNTFNQIQEWLEHVGTATELLEQGVRKIIAAPLLSSIQESMLIDEMRKAVKRRWGNNVQATALKADLDKLKKQIKAKEREEQRKSEKVKEPAWAKGVCYVTNTKDFFRLRTGEKYKAEAFNAAYGRWLLPTEAQLSEQGKQITPANLCQPIVPPADYALNHLKITTVTDYSYDPSQPSEMFFVNGGCRFVNTYSPCYPELDMAHAEEAGTTFLNHLTNLVAEQDYRQTLVDFMAFLVQFPGRKIRWGTMIQGAEGCGKTLLAEMLKAVLGKPHVKTIDGTTVVSGWNEWAFGFQLVVLEEVRVQGTNRYDIMNRLKPWITNEDVPISEKFRNSRDVRNITNYMLFSNHHDALALTPNDRRYFVVKSPLQTKAAVQALGNEYFPELFRMTREMAGGLRSWLTNWEISHDFNPNGHAPRTTYVEQMVADSANDVTSAVRRLLLEGDYPLVQYDIVSESRHRRPADGRGTGLRHRPAGIARSARRGLQPDWPCRVRRGTPLHLGSRRS